MQTEKAPIIKQSETKDNLMKDPSQKVLSR